MTLHTQGGKAAKMAALHYNRESESRGGLSPWECGLEARTPSKPVGRVSEAEPDICNVC